MSLTRDTKAQSTRGIENPKTLSYICGASCKLLVLLIIGASTAARGGGAPTYNGVAMTQAGSAQAGSAECNSELWYLFNPATGSAYDISVPNSDSLSLRLQAESFSGTGAQLFGTPQQTGVSSATPSLTINSVPAGGVCVSVLGHGCKNPPTARSHIVIYETDEGAYSTNGQSGLIAVLGNVTMSWTLAVSDNVAMIMAAFEEVAAPTYKDFSGTASLASSTPAADISKYANFSGAAALAGSTPNAALMRYAGFVGPADLATTVSAAGLQRFANFSGTASLGSNIANSNLSRYCGFVGLAEILSYLPDCDLELAGGSYKDFTGLAALQSAMLEPDLGRYGNFAGQADLVSAVPDIALNRYINYAGLAALQTAMLEPDLGRYGNFAGQASLLTAIAEIELMLGGAVPIIKGEITAAPAVRTLMALLAVPERNLGIETPQIRVEFSDG